ncbi:MAG: DUF4234 domain-containing protein [Coriobacteriales bacterium]|nr:DUF4234 domain-containing protein [Coriobacteriales bacterium]
MICPNCQKENQEGFNFCENCGSELSGAQTNNSSANQDNLVKVCSSCNYQNKSSAKYCHNCGNSVMDVNPTLESFSTDSATNQNYPYQNFPNQDQNFNTQAQGSAQASEQVSSNGYVHYENNGSGSFTPSPTSINRQVNQRNVGLCILFCIITCGIYNLYWIYKIADDANILMDSYEQDTSAGMVLLLSIVTCGIYLIYWVYKTGNKFDIYYAKKNPPQTQNFAMLYLILLICSYISFGICELVCFCLMQDRINKIACGQ